MGEDPTVQPTHGMFSGKAPLPGPEAPPRRAPLSSGLRATPSLANP